MKIFITISHPAHIHFYKNFIWQMQKKGHIIKIAATKKDVSLNLLNIYGFKYDLVPTQNNMGLRRIQDQFLYEYNIYEKVKKFSPDIITGIGGTAASHISKITKAKSIIFTDTEHAKLANLVTFPFADVICTPSCFKKDIGNNQIRYNGYHELAYLHPKYFTPDSAVLDELGLSKDDTFIILRFISWRASHDIGQYGILDKVGLVKKLEKYGRVLITSEGQIVKELEKYEIKTSPEKIFDLLDYASLYLGEGATMATESAILGTPSIYVSSLVGTMGNFIELEQKYGMTFNYKDHNLALEKAIELVQKSNLKEEWKNKRDTLLKDKIDVTAFMIWLIENYPKSLDEIKKINLKMKN